MSGLGLIIDLFAGGGGASTGLTWALGHSPDIAINHDAEALARREPSRHAAPVRQRAGGQSLVRDGRPACRRAARLAGLHAFLESQGRETTFAAHTGSGVGRRAVGGRGAPEADHVGERGRVPDVGAA